MNPAHRDGWPPTQAAVATPVQQQSDQSQGQPSRPLGAFGTSNANQQQASQSASGQSAGPVLPPPSGQYYSSNQTSGHNLPALNSLTGPSQASPSQSAQRPTSSNQEPASAPQVHPGGAQGPGYSLPGISQTLQQPQMHPANEANIDRERDLRERENREREIMEAHAVQEEMIKREAEQREREIRERQHNNSQTAHDNHSAPMIHQPVAVPPSARTVHGPNGILGGSVPLGAPSASLGTPNGPTGIFGSAPVQQNEAAARMQHAVQPPQQSMLMPFAAPGMQPGGPMAMGQGQQPILNDALSYLDQVKVQFADHPDVYNKFLDIMKDFKSGAIDTPGVIERVSSLFTGHPNLIQGFNTFLPPGYKIECGTESDPNAIRVTTPMGTMVSTMPAPRPLSAPRSTAVNGTSAGLNESPYYEAGTWQRHQNRPQGSEAQEGMFSPSNRNLAQPLFGGHQIQNGQAPLSPEVSTRMQPDASSTAAALAHQQEQRGVSQLQNAVSAATGRSMISPSGESATPLPGQVVNGAGMMNQASGTGPAGEKRGPVEFNHAISYVNKIKNRFASQPDIYKQFLEILQTYQRESKPIQDVYAQVTSLFSSAPDLLEDFKQFLPESAAQHRAQQQAARNAAEDAAMLSNVRGEPGYQQAQTQHQTPRADTSRLPPMGNFAPTPTANRDTKRKRGERQVPAATSNSMPTTLPTDTAAPNARSGYGPGNMSKRAKTAHNAKQPVVPDGPPVSPTLTPALPEPLPPTTTTVATHDELSFFDRVKKHLGNKNQMNEFLKLCNLFSQDLIDKNLLLQRSASFIGGNPDLFSWFKEFLRADDNEQQMIRTRAKTVNSRVSLSNCRGLGPSYRLLPKRERERVCSGRDELCRAVLNDEWASHPTWASEDSGFVAHRKNQYEEGLHRIEEERHDYDFNIQALLRTVQQLEPIASQLLTTPGEERLNFVLPPGLGGQSETIYKRVIRKVYGREKGNEVIIELFNQPWNVIPVLMNRLKAKLEEWKAAQREWEKVWREQTQKIFWKSLDHQSISSKQADKRQFQPKTLQNEIQVRYEEQKRLSDIQEISQPDYQFAYSFKDEEVLFDCARLILTYAEQNSNATDYSKVIPFVKEFVPLFFGIDPAKFEERVQSFGRDSSNESADEDMASPDDGASYKASKAKKPTLLRDVLDRGRSGKPGRKDKEDSIASGSRDSTPDIVSGADDEGVSGEISKGNLVKSEPIEARWVEYASGSESGNGHTVGVEEPYRRSIFNMYANLPIYCFFRMFVILYERLLKLKETEVQVRDTVSRAMMFKPAKDLKMIDKLPDEFFRDVSDTANFYEQVLFMFEEQIKGEIDMNHIEETLRRYYLHSGWQLYSFERLLSALVRFNVSLFNNDNKERTADIYQLFKKDRPNDLTTHKAELTYRKAVEKYAKDADTYKIAFDPAKMEAYVRLFKRDEPTFDFGNLDRVKKWRCYVASYMTVEPTEDVESARVRIPYLKNSLARVEDLTGEQWEAVRTEDKTTVKILHQGYELKFEQSDTTGGVTFVVQTDATRTGYSADNAGPKEELKRLTDSKNELAQSKLVRNNAWMRDVSKDDVDASKTAFKRDIDEIAAKPVEGDEDAEMLDA